MNGIPSLHLNDEVTAALAVGQPVVALESTLIAHGLPWPINLDTARAADAAVRTEGAVPATIAVWQGRPAVGISLAEITELARGKDVRKASRRDLAEAIAQGRTAATTVAATMFLAHRAGIRLFATGGIGGAHRVPAGTWDISADLGELARTPVCVVCAGAKNVLDIARTLEILETYSVPVLGYQTDEFPAFYLRSSGQPVSVRVNSPAEAAALLEVHWNLEGAGVVLAQPVANEVALGSGELQEALMQAENQAADTGIRGAALTPFLLARMAEATQGQTLRANQALVIANARLAAQVAKLLL
jgi:pseudouridylate synthase